MKIQISDNKRSEIEAFLTQFKPAIESLRSLFEGVTELENRRADNQSALAEVNAFPDPSDKQIQERMICRERAAILEGRSNELASAVVQEKKGIVLLANGAMELFRVTAGQQIFDGAEAELKASLPAAITSDNHLLWKVWHEGAEKRRIGSFLNPPQLSPRDDVEEILQESERRAQLLDDLLQGREILPELQTANA